MKSAENLFMRPWENLYIFDTVACPLEFLRTSALRSVLFCLTYEKRLIASARSRLFLPVCLFSRQKVGSRLIRLNALQFSSRYRNWVKLLFSNRLAILYFLHTLLQMALFLALVYHIRLSNCRKTPKRPLSFCMYLTKVHKNTLFLLTNVFKYTII